MIYNKFKNNYRPYITYELISACNVYITNTISQSYVGSGNLILPDLTYFNGICQPGISESMTSKIYNIDASNILITSTGGSTGPFRYIVIAESSDACTIYPNTDDRLICYFDYGYSITLQDGESLSVNFKSGKLLTVK